MTNPAKVIVDAMLMDIRNDSEITKEKVIATLILITRERRLSQEDFREMNQILRTEMGCSRVIWEATGVALIESLPDVSQGHAIELMRQE